MDILVSVTRCDDVDFRTPRVSLSCRREAIGLSGVPGNNLNQNILVEHKYALKKLSRTIAGYKTKSFDPNFD